MLFSRKPSSRWMVLCAFAVCCGCQTTKGKVEQAEMMEFANQHDLKREPVFRARENDWRNGAVVYQVIVDRFAPPGNLDAKRELYPPPKKLRSWDEVPAHGTYNEEAEVWSHEIDFWGGDLRSLQSKLDYIQQLDVDVLYLNPIHLAYTNHKYDAQDYFKVSPEYGTRDDVKDLAANLHARGMELVLDGVFNHMGRTSPWFQDAISNPASPWRDWYFIGPEYKMGYRGWYNVANLPELRLENPRVRARLYGDRDSVIQGYLRDGVDGWRLDVAFDIGFDYLNELTRAAHDAKRGSLVVGEVWNYPKEWFPALDGVMDMTARQLILQFLRGEMEGDEVGRNLQMMVDDCGVENLLKSWIVLDNHDTKRLRNSMPEEWQQRMAQILQFTLPGSPCVYYGVEVGMTGGDDPEMRGPMRWDLVGDQNPQYVWMKRLLELHKNNRALRVGDYRSLHTDRLLAFVRQTNRVGETVVVVANPGAEEVKEVLLIPDSKIMNYSTMVDQLSDARFTVLSGTMPITVPPHTAYILKVMLEQPGEYTPFKRVLR